MANNQDKNYAITEADLTPPADLRLHRSYGFYDYNTSSNTSSTSNPIPTTNTDIAAAHRGLQEADANDCSSGSGIALKIRVAEIIDRMDINRIKNLNHKGRASENSVWASKFRNWVTHMYSH